jgi:hypothetical protein
MPREGGFGLQLGIAGLAMDNIIDLLGRRAT